MRIPTLAVAVSATLLAGCASGGIMNRNAPDEFAVTRGQPLVIPPDFSLTPPRPGDPGAAVADARTQALQAIFGGPAPRSAAESQVLQQAGEDRAAPGARSTVGDPDTNVVERGQLTSTIVAVPEGDGQEASVSVPQ